MSSGHGRSVLVFKPIDWDAHREVCVAYRRETFLCSFGWDGFFAKEGPGGEKYLARLQAQLSRFPEGNVHVWRDGEIIGQLEMRVLDDARRAHVSLFYLAAPIRGSGAGDELQRYALQFMRAQGVEAAQLLVSSTNTRALAYYKKHGWTCGGLQSGRDDMQLLERSVTSSVL